MDVFTATMPKRREILNRIYRAKRKADARVVKQGKFGKDDIKELKYIIGEDVLFRSAEKRHKQSLRHCLYKNIKSFDKMYKNRSRILKMIEADPKLAKGFPEFIEFATYIKFIKSDLETYFKSLDLIRKKQKKLDKIFIDEIKALQVGSFEEYSKLLQQEQELVAYITTTANRYVKNIKKMAFDGKTLAEKFIKGYKEKNYYINNRPDWEGIRVIVACAFYAGFLGSLLAINFEVGDENMTIMHVLRALGIGIGASPFGGLVYYLVQLSDQRIQLIKEIMRDIAAYD